MQPSFCDHSITAYLKGFNEIKVRIGVLVQDNGIASGKWNAAPAFVDAGMIKFGELAPCSALPACLPAGESILGILGLGPGMGLKVNRRNADTLD